MSFSLQQFSHTISPPNDGLKSSTVKLHTVPPMTGNPSINSYPSGSVLFLVTSDGAGFGAIMIDSSATRLRGELGPVPLICKEVQMLGRGVTAHEPGQAEVVRLSMLSGLALVQRLAKC